jgi:sigma-E factor negative regulatory protein RseA
MANDQEERVSALADGELDHHQLDALLARMRKDDALRARWARYHLISDALHNNLTRGTQLDISRRVSAAIEQEPVIFAPLWQRAFPSRRMVKQAAGVAMAASVTAVAILGAQWVNRDMSAPAVPALASVATPEPPKAIELVAMESPSMGQPAVAQMTGSQQPADQVWIRNLDSYVVNHNEYAGSSSMHSVLPYARLVSHEPHE